MAFGHAVSFSLPKQVLSFGSKYLSGLGELVFLKNVNQISLFMQVALKTSPEAALKNLEKKKVELIVGYVFNSSRLFQGLTKYIPCV